MASLPLLDSEYEEEVSKTVADNISQSKKEWDDYEVSWDFTRHPLVPLAKDRQEQEASQFRSSRIAKLRKIGREYQTPLPYELELAEYITIPDGKGDVAITLTRDVEDDFLKIDEMVSGDLDAYNDCSPEAIAEVFKDNPAMALSAILVPHVSAGLT